MEGEIEKDKDAKRSTKAGGSPVVHWPRFFENRHVVGAPEPETTVEGGNGPECPSGPCLQGDVRPIKPKLREAISN